ncbi:MAG: GntR family transcriptional regulator [Burkholderiales bacterium]|nr:GntR family transcriptional regulator [Burkholderiales bacterium]
MAGGRRSPSGAAGGGTLIREVVHDGLRADILSCALMPGSLLQENDLALRYGVSKSPVRDALLRLEQQGLIEVLPRKGYRVRPVSVADAAEMYEMRLLLERACVARAIDHADPATLAALDSYRDSGRTTDLPSWIAYNRAFHLAVARAAGSARLARAAGQIIEEFDRLTYMSIVRFSTDGLAALVAEHGALIDALQARDRRRAQVLARTHVEEARDRLLDAISRLAVVP